MRLFYILALALAWLTGPPAVASASVLAVTVGGTKQQFSSASLLARTDAVKITVPHDPSYARPMQYRAVPLRALLSTGRRDTADTIEVRATDGFVAQIPRRLIEGAATPWVAIEDPARPWPRLPQKRVSAGPFYLVWQNPERSEISPEQWPYAIASLTAVASPVQRWPKIAVATSLPAASPLRRGQSLFIANCLACHRLGGQGEGTVGPDLLQPMPATAYLTDAGFRALIRNPAAVRSWPEQRMPAFDKAVISDSDINAIIAYLRALAPRRR